jgi:hypothetical protein
MKRNQLLCAVIILLISSLSAQAHQPVIVGKDIITIEKPEISRAFYHELTGQPRVYLITADKTFDLYINLLVPKNTNAAGRYSARVYQVTGNKKVLLTELKADSITWKEFYEPFGGDSYLKGPEFKQNVPSGKYKIEVYSKDNRGKYVLAVGEKEFFGPKEIISVYTEVPKLKSNFFGVNPCTFLITPFGLVMVIIVGVAVCFLLKRRHG